MRIIKTSNETTIIPDSLSVYIIPRLIISLYLITIGYKTVSGSKVKSPAQLPSFKDTQSSYTFPEGALAVLYCSIQNLGARTVVWRKATYPNPLTVGKMTYVPDDRYQVHHIPDKEEWNLLIKDIQHNDSGIYECQISTKEKYIRKLIRVIVVDRPYAKRDIVITGRQKMKKGETLLLSCKATGGKSAPDDLDWIKGNRKLISDKSGRINITKHISYVTNTIISNLTIKQAVANDAGTYECRTTDSMSRQFSVDVTGESSDKDKRTITQHAPATSCATTSTVVLYVFVFCVHCSFRYRRVLQLLTTIFKFWIVLAHSIMT
ncbi:lachesin-like [Ruditapes philippinarum]|uniref:lachesin-like n=1 Tax=Ruditapes philippinarum TaxID=129788 RepID=UPI00295C2ADF|nr:lachesin-like [Ruditapes philippinarum]XP_060605642.1 lachesin-like [Ruditapes philippinarum]XP_060605652.1 lachesin-like [Ruditapes philippinarum]XP_060605660.1 lachesin-like [Ruditapes philippinarum]XP_060605668.1 lachesin-like [Ruditapes philippinarum]XP_060605675.1 lachesin-like [Ruditapes philippinarum]